MTAVAANAVPPSGEVSRASVRAAIGAWGGFFTGTNVMLSSVAGLFIAPWTRSFGLNRTDVSWLLLISPFVIALGVPLAGRLMDRYGLRRVLIPAVILFAALQATLGLAQTAWQLALLIFVLSMVGALHSSVGYVKLVSMWFAQRRGLVLGMVVAFGSGGGSILMPQIVRRLIEHFGWRLAYVGIGCIILAIGLPLIALCVREPGRARSGGAPLVEQPGLTRPQALRTPTLWILFFAILFASMAIIATIVHMFAILTERGFSPGIATTALSVAFFGGVIGQLSSGAIADRFNSPRVILPFFVCAVVGVFAVYSVATVPLLFGGALLMGLGQGAEIALAGYLTSRYFGLRAFGSIYSLFFAASNFGICCGILLLGRIHDITGSYAAARPLSGGFMIVSLVLMALLGRYVYAKRPT